MQQRTTELSLVLEDVAVLIIKLALCFSECTSWHMFGNVSVSKLTATAFLKCFPCRWYIKSSVWTLFFFN